jgi:hypothetical protein
LGTFWQAYLADRDLLRTHQWGKLQLHADAYLRSVELAAANSIEQVTPFCARQWRLIRLLESELNQDPNKIRFGSGHTFGDGTLYGQLQAQSYVWVVPSDVKSIGLLVDHVVAPQHVFDASNCAFDPVRGELRFAANPFTFLPVLPVYDGAGTLIDRQVLLWARNVGEDKETPYLRYGAILGIQGKSSADYVAILRSCWHMLVLGPSVAEFAKGLLGSVGLPWVQGGETVERIASDSAGQAVITDKSVYRVHSGATILVSVGDQLTEGDFLVDTVQVLEFGTGEAHDYSSLLGLAAGPELVTGVQGPVVFPNVETTWEVQGTGDVQFTLYGDPRDTSGFWEAVHATGVAQGQTLAQLLGINAPGIVRAVNPLKFVVENILGANLLVVSVKPEHFLAFEPGFLTRVQRMLPAGTLLLIQTILQPRADSLDLGSFPATATAYAATEVLTDVSSISATVLTYTDFEPVVTAS